MLDNPTPNNIVTLLLERWQKTNTKIKHENAWCILTIQIKHNMVFKINPGAKLYQYCDCDIVNFLHTTYNFSLVQLMSYNMK